MSLEDLKAQSRGLRGSLPIELEQPAPSLSEEARQILKFHGVYQQHDRDIRGRQNRHYSFMVRSKLPGGKLTAQQYLVHDLLADEFGQGDLRLTTRQGIQLHGVVKGDLRSTLRALNLALVSTLAACGDVERNVMCCPAPLGDPVREQLQSYAERIAAHLCPRTPAYHEIWLEGDDSRKTRQHFGKNGSTVEVEEPIYGKTYLPRKFKTAIAYAGDNCTDVFTNDIGLIALVDEEQKAVQGFNVFVGGGMGKTHNKEETFPLLAQPLGYVPAQRMVDVVEKIVLVQRDFGNREDRRRARMKYLVHEWGIDRFRDQVETYLGYALEILRPMPEMEVEDHLGWFQKPDGLWFCGIYVENGRIQDQGDRRLRSGLQAIMDRFWPEVFITPQQNIILSGFDDAQKYEVEIRLHQYGIPAAEEISNLRRHAMACPALPTCGLAIAEAERRLPGLLDLLEQDAEDLGLAGEKLAIRMTGCPNGCARPFVSDIGIVGRSLDKYEVSLGGNQAGTRLNYTFADIVPAAELRPLIYRLLAAYRDHRQPGEGFGDWADRLGSETVRTLAASVDVPV